jgi:inner membrane protein
MSTPVGHFLLGSTLGYGPIKRVSPNSWVTLGLLLVLSNLSDIDYLFGLPTGNPSRYHHFWTHSLIFTGLFGILSGILFWIITNKSGWKLGFIVFLIMASHLILDFFTKDTSEPIGLQLFWPFSTQFYISPVTIFRDVAKSAQSQHFFASLFCLHNLWTVLLEAVILGPPFVWVIYRQGRFNRQQEHTG